jgi:glycerate kinase
LLTTTRGTGELLRAAVAHGARTIWLAVGGSATVDGGAGAAAALGWRFWDAAGAPIEPVGGTLRRITRIEPPPAPFGCAVEVLCDVDSPLCGPHGAAAVFGPQKGATPAAVRQLDDGLRHLAALIERELGKQVADLPGAGAAGGLGAGAAAFLDARLVSGAESIIRAVGLADHAAGAVWLVTGEGCLDSQSLRGKVVARVAALGRQQGCRVAAFAGMVLLSELQSQAAGIDRAVAITPPDLAWREALQKAPSLLAAAAGRFAAEYLA